MELLLPHAQKDAEFVPANDSGFGRVRAHGIDTTVGNTPVLWIDEPFNPLGTGFWAKLEGHTRALCSAEKARPMLDGAIVLIGNAPLALARIARYILEEGVRPALVVGMPVGFVNVVESKDLLARCPVPQIVLEGRRGGSALAVTTLHAIMESA